MAIDRNEFVFVVDCNNRRVLLLSPQLTYILEVVSREQSKWWPIRVHFDSVRGRLHVADIEFKYRYFKSTTIGRVVVVIV